MAAGEDPEYGLPGVSSRTRIEQLSIRVVAIVWFNFVSQAVRYGIRSGIHAVGLIRFSLLLPSITLNKGATNGCARGGTRGCVVRGLQFVLGCVCCAMVLGMSNQFLVLYNQAFLPLQGLPWDSDRFGGIWEF